MSRKKVFFSKLKKSTIITLVSCGTFVVATFCGLLILTKFPIEPPEKMTATLGRRSTYELNSAYSTTQAVTVTTESTTTTAQTTSKETTHTDFVITVTMGKGFSEDYGNYGYTPYLDDAMQETGTTPTVTITDNDDYDENYFNDYSY
ncbi:MAG: hypothetical protein K2J08_11460 [Ruminococcus sp.]|nr:hypothetical protein [Ruminococcus sp.]